ncbi:phage regulatory protein/antirepressor Ant [Proteiniclasticum sp.]|uniref:phage regulatory protein/antirepressor Ant n=1 Tax=Proteiniclasticum sp. TaxID=2053595 RepID=UPI0028994F9B|nr:phage regulatory protein/antirepressor Ant [Proteiniclasticum sp.]
MSDLTTINKGRVVVSSRRVAQDFNKEHGKVIRSIEDHVKELLNIGKPEVAYEMFSFSTYESRGKQYPEYLMNRDGFSLLVMSFNNTRDVLDWKIKYINAFNRMEELILQKSPSYQIADPIERAKAWIQEQEEKKALEGHIEELKPKALFADSVASSRNSILVGELAKLLNQNGIDIGQKRLFQVLRDKGYLLKSGEDYNIPSQYSMDLKIMDIKKSSVNNPDGSVRITRTPKVTGKGQIYFVNKFLKGELK